MLLSIFTDSVTTDNNNNYVHTKLDECREVGLPQRFIIHSQKEMCNLLNTYNGIKKFFMSVYKPIFCDDPDQRFDKVNINIIMFDFDDKDRYTHANKLHHWCLKNGIRHLVVFSGKGYHIYISTCNGSNLVNPKSALYNAQKLLINKLGITCDEKIIGNTAQMCRVINSFNTRRGRFCIPITKEDMDFGHDYIKEKAKKQNWEVKYYGRKHFDISNYDSKAIENGDKIVLDEESKKQINADEELKKLPPCISNMLHNKITGYNDRYDIILCMKEIGYLKGEVIKILEAYLPPHKFKHCIREEKQVNYIFRRDELMFSCERLKKRNLCIKWCKTKIYR